MSEAAAEVAEEGLRTLNVRVVASGYQPLHPDDPWPTYVLPGGSYLDRNGREQPRTYEWTGSGKLPPCFEEVTDSRGEGAVGASQATAPAAPEPRPLSQDSRAVVVTKACEKLDGNNPDHWTGTGQPRLKALAEFMPEGAKPAMMEEVKIYAAWCTRRQVRGR